MPDYLRGSSSACYQVCTLLGPTALPQKVGTLYPDTSPPTDNSLATNHRPFAGMKNRFSTYCGLPYCLFHCLLLSLHTPWTHCIASECWHTLPRHLSTNGQLTCHKPQTFSRHGKPVFHQLRTAFLPISLSAAKTAFLCC